MNWKSTAISESDMENLKAPKIRDITQKLDDLMRTYEEKYKFARCLPLPAKYKLFYDLVKNKAELDLKNQPDWQDEKFIYDGEVVDNDVPGNIMYGYMGKVFDIPDMILCAAAGAAQKKAGTSKKEWDNMESFGDDPRDTKRIKQGIAIYKKRHKTILDRIFE